MTLVRETHAARTVQRRLHTGVTVPAHPLALTAEGRMDERAQRALTRYYVDAGADGVAVGVHSTQFEVHADRGMLQAVWELAVGSSELPSRSQSDTDSPQRKSHDTGSAHRDPLLIAGIVGDVDHAVAEAELAAELGYHAALLCPWGMTQGTEQALLERATAVGQVLPTIGFYLQQGVGGTHLSRKFWRQLFDLESVIAVKTAPFDRYRTNDVMQTLLEHERWEEIAVLTGNDDTIVQDLITPYRRTVRGQERVVRATGGLLGQWGAGTRAAVHLVKQTQDAAAAGWIPLHLLATAADMVEINDAVFDVAHGFAGCVAGVNETLRQQGVLRTADCLGSEALSSGQSDLIRHARKRYPELLDEDFVAQNKDAWLS